MRRSRAISSGTFGQAVSKGFALEIPSGLGSQESRESGVRSLCPKRLAAVSQVNQHRIFYEVKSYFLGNSLRLEVAPDGVGNLFLEFSQILTLGRNAAKTIGSIPRRDEKS